ncbi:MAG TPA: hypothetical protein VF618_03055 [Thermoanaerobaculia bacterium]
MTRTLFLIAALVALPAVADDFTYELPPGWVDLVKTDLAGAPEFLVKEARSGKYKIWAADPDAMTPLGAPVNMNVVEQAGSGKVTKEAMEEAASGMRAQFEKLGIDATILGEPQLQQLDGVPIGVLDSTLTAPNGKLRLRQYFIPGEKKVAVLTYACSPDAYDEYRNLFEVSARATKGARKTSGLGGGGDGGGIDWTRAFVVGALGAVGGGALGLLLQMKKKKAVLVAPRVVASMWECATCKRKVPVRMDTCRCGAGRPG